MLDRLTKHIRSIPSFRGLTTTDTFRIILSLLLGYSAFFLSYGLRPLREVVKKRIGSCNAEFIDKIARIKYVVLRTPDGPYFIIRPMDYWTVLQQAEPEVNSIFRPKRGEVVIDIGAHVGAYTIRVARAVGEEGLTIALEPEPENFRLLDTCVKLNDLDKVILLPMAAYEVDGTFTLYVSQVSGWHSLVEIPERLMKRIDVPSIRLDSLVDRLNLDKVDWVKIDAEGAELAILRGAPETLETARNLIIEILDKNAEKVFSLLRSREYEVRFLARYSEKNFYIWARKI